MATVLLLFLWVTSVLVAAPALAAGAVTVQIAPATMTLEPGDVATVDLVIANGTDKNVSITGIRLITPPRIAAEQTDLVLPAEVPAGAAVRAGITLAATPGSAAGDVAASVEFTPAGGGPLTIVSTSVALKAGTAAQSPEVTLIGLPASVEDGQSRTSTVRIANTTAFTYQDIRLASLGGDYVNLVLPADDPPAPFVACPDPASGPGSALACLPRLDPGEAALLSVLVQADVAVRTGKAGVGVVVTGSRVTAPGSEPVGIANAVATGEVELTVLGVDALSPYGIGALFLVPGLVAVLVFLLGARVYPRTKGLPDTIGLTDLWAMPIVVSAAAFVYWVVWLFNGQNWTREVSTSIVGFLFVGGAALGAAVWIVLALLWMRLVSSKKFVVGDDGRKVLKRLKARRNRLHLPEFTLNGVRYYYLVPGENGTVLATPAINYSFPSGTDDGSRRSFFVACREDDVDAVLEAERTGTVVLEESTASGVQALDGAEVNAGKLALVLHGAPEE